VPDHCRVELLAPLRHPGYRRVWLANLASNAGTWLHVVAAGWLIYDITESPAAVGALAMVTRGPAILLSMLGGGLADRYDRRFVGAWMFLLQAIAAGALAVVTWVIGPSLPAIYALTFVTGVGFALSLPALLALLPALVPREELSGAVSLNAAGINVARLAGPAIGGAMLAFAGAGTCFLVNGLSFFALVVVLVRARPRPVDVSGAGVRLRQALAHAARDRAIRRLLIGMAVFVTLAAPVQELAPVMADLLDSGPVGLGLLLGCMGGGALIGAWALERLGRAGLPRHVALSGASVMFAVGLAGVAVSPVLPVAMGTIAFAGAFWIWMYAGTNTSIQLRSPPELLGRMLGLYQLSVIGPLAVGSLAAGAIAEQIGIRWTFGLCAALLATWGAWSLRNAVPEIDAPRGRGPVEAGGSA
jgi:MFS family permease